MEIKANIARCVGDSFRVYFMTRSWELKWSQYTEDIKDDRKKKVPKINLRRPEGLCLILGKFFEKSFVDCER